MKQRKRKTKYFTFLLIPDNERETKSLRLRANVLKLLSVVVIALLVLIIVAGSTYWRLAEIAIDYSDLSDENRQLKEGLNRLESVQSELERLKKMDQKLRMSLSGYVSIIEQTENMPEINPGVLDNLDDMVYDRSIFNSIPDLYPVDGFITRGYEEDSFLSEAHLGIDIAGPKSSPVRATADGVVIFSGWTYEEGSVVMIKHGLNFYSVYKHNERNLCQEWEYVKKGQIIALLGDTGEISSGPHVHFEVWQGAHPVDPERLLRKN